MLGVTVNIMTLKEINITLLSTLPEDVQEEIYAYLTTTFRDKMVLPQKTEEEFFAELKESRSSAERGEYKDFDLAIDEICKKYSLQGSNN